MSKQWLGRICACFSEPSKQPCTGFKMLKVKSPTHVPQLGAFSCGCRRCYGFACQRRRWRICWRRLWPTKPSCRPCKYPGMPRTRAKPPVLGTLDARLTTCVKHGPNIPPAPYCFDGRHWSCKMSPVASRKATPANDTFRLTFHSAGLIHSVA